VGARDLATKAAALTNQGALLVGVLQDGANLNVPATQKELDTWITSEGAIYSWVLDGPSPQPPLQTFFTLPRDYFVIIDLSTMQVVTIVAGSVPAASALGALLAPNGGG
jgi:hypothetical protein